MPPIRLTWLGHASLVLDLDGVRIVTDPLLRPHLGVLRRRGAAPTRVQWHGTDAVLLSHLHHDHADLASLRMLEVPVLTGEENAGFLRRHDVPGTPLAGDWVSAAGTGVEVRLTRADHGHRPMPHRPNATHGHLLRAGDLRIWVAGDTALYPEMERIPELAGGDIDVAVVPVGGWGPRLSGGHLSPADAAEACRRVGAKIAVPYHWGTFHVLGAADLPAGWMDRPGVEFPAEVERLAPGCRAVVLAPGGSVVL